MATVISEFCEVVQATDGQHGLETAFNTIPDVIISDIMMPGRDGFLMPTIASRRAYISHTHYIAQGQTRRRRLHRRPRPRGRRLPDEAGRFPCPQSTWNTVV